MARIAALLRRYSTLLFLVCIAVLATVAIAQTVRLRYLEQRHQQTFADFGEAMLELNAKANRLTDDLARCRQGEP